MASLVYHREGQGEPLLLLHGIGGRWQMWQPVLPLLVAERDVIAVDLPGYGASEPLPPGTPPGIPAISDALERFLDELGLPTVHLGGNSLGGWLSLELARRGRARSVTGLSPAGFFNRREAAYAHRCLTSSVQMARRFAPHADQLMATKAMRTLLLGQIFARPWRIPAQVAADDMRALAASRAFDSDLAEAPHERFLPGPALGVPVTIAWAQRDRLLLPRQGPRAIRRIPGARLITLPGCGHVPMWDDPPLVARVLLEGSRTSAAPVEAPAAVAAA